MNFKRAIIESIDEYPKVGPFEIGNRNLHLNQIQNYNRNTTLKDLDLKLQQLELNKQILIPPSSSRNQSKNKSNLNLGFSKHFDTANSNNFLFASNGQNNQRESFKQRVFLDCTLSPLRSRTYMHTTAQTLLNDSPLFNDEILYSGFRTPSQLQSIRSSPKNFTLDLVTEQEANGGVDMIYHDQEEFQSNSDQEKVDVIEDQIHSAIQNSTIRCQEIQKPESALRSPQFKLQKRKRSFSSERQQWQQNQFRNMNLISGSQGIQRAKFEDFQTGIVFYPDERYRKSNENQRKNEEHNSEVSICQKYLEPIQSQLQSQYLDQEKKTSEIIQQDHNMWNIIHINQDFQDPLISVEQQQDLSSFNRLMFESKNKENFFIDSKLATGRNSCDIQDFQNYIQSQSEDRDQFLVDTYNGKLYQSDKLSRRRTQMKYNCSTDMTEEFLSDLKNNAQVHQSLRQNRRSSHKKVTPLKVLYENLTLF